jgi:hypothetical protein
MKSKLFPGPSSRPKRVFAASAGNSQHTHVLPNEDGYKGGMLGWKGSRSAGGPGAASRSAAAPHHNSAQAGEGGLAWDSSMSGVMTDKGKP